MGQDTISKQEVLDGIKYANISMGIYLTNDETDIRLLVNYTFDALTAIGATALELMKALERVELTQAELPRNLSASFFKNAVLTLRAKTKERQQQEEETRETSEADKMSYVEIYYNHYKVGGATWAHWSAGSAWIARFLKLDLEPFMEKARAKVSSDTRDESLAKGLRTMVANVEPNKVEAEAGRMAVQAYFRERFDKEIQP